MNSQVPRRGILAALWLPTDADGEIRRTDLEENLFFLKSKGIHGVLALGSTGEFPQFTVDQRRRALDLVAELAAPLPVIANVSDLRPRAVAELARHARALGLPAIAIMTPGFFPSNQDDVLAHLLHAAEHASLPTFLYNFPELTGTRINLETVAAFAERAPLAGVKQSGKEFTYHRELVALGREKNFVVFSGADTRLPEVFSQGAVGCIGGLVNIAPELMLQMFRQGCEGEVGSLEPAFSRLVRIGQSIDRLTFPLNVAAGMAARGLAVGEPKAIVSSASRELYRKIVGELSKEFDAWGLARGLRGSSVIQSTAL